MTHPDIINASVSFQGSVDATLKPGVSNTKARSIALRIRDYMASHYPDIDEMVIGEINIHHDVSEAPQYVQNLYEAAQAHDRQGIVYAIVEQGVESTDRQQDHTWHVVINRKMIR